MDDYAARAIAAGYDAFAITLDVQMISRREGMITSRYQKFGVGGSLSGGAAGLGDQAAFSWADISRFRQRWPHVNLILKGIMTVKDAQKAVGLGCAGVSVDRQGHSELPEIG